MYNMYNVVGKYFVKSILVFIPTTKLYPSNYTISVDCL